LRNDYNEVLTRTCIHWWDMAHQHITNWEK